MLSQRWRPVLWCALALVAIWAVAVTGFIIARNSRVTAEKVLAYMQSTDLSKLTGTARAKALHDLADKLNRLSYEERRRARMDRASWGWFSQMTEEEKAAFLEATMPTGFKQMITAFEELSEDKRKRTIDDTLRRLRESRNKDMAEGSPGPDGTNAPPVLSKEMEAQIRTIGLKTFFNESSAQTKAELAPVLEEMQRVMESGRTLRGR